MQFHLLFYGIILAMLMLAFLRAYIQIPHLKEVHVKNILKTSKILLLLVYQKKPPKPKKLHFFNIVKILCFHVLCFFGNHKSAIS